MPPVTGIWSSLQTSVHCLTCCSAAHLKRGPNVALSSPQSAAIECFLARLGKSVHPRLDWLGLHPRRTKATAPRQANRDLGSNPCSVACVCSAFPVCCLAVTYTTVYPTAHFRFPFYLSRARTVRWFISRTEARRQGRPHRLHGRLPRTWPPTRRALIPFACSYGNGGHEATILGLHSPRVTGAWSSPHSSVFCLAALQRRPVLYHSRWLLVVLWPWPSVHLGQLAPTTLPQCRLVSNPCSAGLLRPLALWHVKTCHVRTQGAQRRPDVSPSNYSVQCFNRCLAALQR